MGSLGLWRRSRSTYSPSMGMTWTLLCHQPRGTPTRTPEIFDKQDDSASPQAPCAVTTRLNPGNTSSLIPTDTTEKMAPTDPKRASLGPPPRITRSSPPTTTPTRTATKAPLKQPIADAEEAAKHLEGLGYTAPGQYITALNLADFLFQATLSLPRTNKEAISTFRALAFAAQTLAVDVTAERIAAAVAERLADPVSQVNRATAEAAAAAADSQRAALTAREAASFTLDAAEACTNASRAAEETAHSIRQTSQARTPAATWEATPPQAIATQPLAPVGPPPRPAAPALAAEIARGDDRDRRFVVDWIAPDENSGTLTNRSTIQKAEVAIALMAEVGICGPPTLAFVSATQMRDSSVVYHLDSAASVRWLMQPAVRPKFIAHLEGASSVSSHTLHCVVEYVPVSFDPDSEASLAAIEEDSVLDAKTIQFARWLKKPDRRAPFQKTAFMLFGFLTREAANEAIERGLSICGRNCPVRRLMPEPRRCLKCQKWDPGHLAAKCPATQDVCARCAKGHRTASCQVVAEADLECHNCISAGRESARTHGAGDRLCPAFVECQAALLRRVPGARYRFFPTDHPRTWEHNRTDIMAPQSGGGDAAWLEDRFFERADALAASEAQYGGGWSMQHTGRNGRGRGRLAGGSWGGGGAVGTAKVPLPQGAGASPPPPAMLTSQAKGKKKGKKPAKSALVAKRAVGAGVAGGGPAPAVQTHLHTYWSQASKTVAADASWATAPEGEEAESGDDGRWPGLDGAERRKVAGGGPQTGAAEAGGSGTRSTGAAEDRTAGDGAVAAEAAAAEEEADEALATAEIARTLQGATACGPCDV